MRSVTYRFAPDAEILASGGLDPEALGVTLDAVHDLRELADGSVVARVTVGGDPDQLEGRVVHGDALRDVQVVSGQGTALVQCHFQPSTGFADLLEVHRSHAVVVEFPIQVVDVAGPTLRIVASGHIDELKGLVDGTRALGTVTIEEVGSYDRHTERLFATLTDRQQQVLQTALEAGYYDVPRDVTYEDIARQLDCSASRVGQHLRRIEARVLSAVAPPTDALAEPPLH